LGNIRLMSKLVLDTSAMEEDFFSDTSLIGIASTLPGYRFCWMINNHMNVHFEREPQSDLVFRLSETEHLTFALYRYCLPLNGSKYSIYKLRTEAEALMPELKQLDYLWMIEGADAEVEAPKIAGQLRLLPDVLLAQVLNAEKLKNLSHLLV
jgi:hypothetical protein